MEKIIVDNSTLAKLGHLRQQYEICDDSGRLLGRFFPVAEQSLYDDIALDISDEELDRRSQETEVYSTAEVIRRLEQL
ncbi:MAG TPA: hypothetical protein VJ809_15205 [Pirellulales bacterium]|jgi:hypothetical protein|nr:hypothetical protein [Pirellulales bacterium]